MALFQADMDELAEKGNELFDDGAFVQAIEVWQKALDALPQPLTAQSEAVWFQTSVADAWFQLEEYGKAYPYLADAKSNLSGAGYTNPFVMLRLGQCAYELGKQEAAEYLMRAYMLAGEEIFEDENEKYFNLIRPLI